MAYNERDFQTAIVCGLMSKGRELKGNKIPIAYLYNGVQLPKLPEWDKSKYPYAVIRSYRSLVSTNPITYADKYALYIMSVRPYKKSGYENLGISADGYLRSVTCANGAWGEFGAEVSINTAWGGYIPFWTNTDILNEDETVYISASEPIPVYE